MYEEKIDDAVRALGTVSVLLIELKKRINEFAVQNDDGDVLGKFLDVALSGGSRRQEVLQLNTNVGAKELGIETVCTKKEIQKMPKLKDFSYRIRGNCHEFRYRKNGFNKSFCNKDLKVAKRRALDFCNMLNKNEALLSGRKSKVSFGLFADEYLRTVKAKNVGKKTFDNYYNRFNLHILPVLKDYPLSDIKAPILQKLLNGILDKGYNRTAEDCYYLLKTIFQYAVDNENIDKNPISAVKIPMHRRTNGAALTLEEEKNFLSDIKGNKYELNFLVLLYTGCRPCELSSLAFVREGFITFRNMKQKNGKIAYKDIPITPMLRPYVDKIRLSPLPKTTELAKIFSSLCSKHKMYDLRHTFASRCQECGVPQEIVAHWLGHKSSALIGQVYTHYSPEFMLKMGEKVRY